MNLFTQRITVSIVNFRLSFLVKPFSNWFPEPVSYLSYDSLPLKWIYLAKMLLYYGRQTNTGNFILRTIPIAQQLKSIAFLLRSEIVNFDEVWHSITKYGKLIFLNEAWSYCKVHQKESVTGWRKFITKCIRYMQGGPFINFVFNWFLMSFNNQILFITDLKSGNSRKTVIYFWSGLIKKNHFLIILLKLVIDIEAFINYNFSYTRFRSRKIILGAHPCM